MKLTEETAKDLIESFDTLSEQLKEFREHFNFGVITERQEGLIFNLTEELRENRK
ncbi:hypothetical protein EV201_3360 [Ancylomarina subtilis]|uniref:Uncharacterized protein n=1 Tax=Ancylomarina subtilis TaxID=1639035 RepID=A0A4Q7V6J3_9BACT|nr:hypothetical protein [Ancylomarina subtilis]RZT91030.1 hypothetical protein EV201_3360 [Ancylomarina subtilis]